MGFESNVVTKGIGDINSTERGTGARYNNGKPDFSLLPLTMVAEYYDELYDDGTETIPRPAALDVLYVLGAYQETHDPEYLGFAFALLGDDAWANGANVFSYGKIKYKEWNWARGMPWSVPLACAARHCVDILEGADIDEEKDGVPGSGLPHEGHIMCNLVMLKQFHRTYPEGNDLPTIGLLGNGFEDTKPAINFLDVSEPEEEILVDSNTGGAVSRFFKRVRGEL